MKKKIFINAFYNLMLILCTIGVFWAYENQSPLIIIFFVTVFASILFFKVRLIKDLRRELKSPAAIPPPTKPKAKKKK